MEFLNLSGLYLCMCFYNKWFYKFVWIVNILEMSLRCVCKYFDFYVDICICIMFKFGMLFVLVDIFSVKILDVFCICWEVYVLISIKMLDVFNVKIWDVY